MTNDLAARRQLLVIVNGSDRVLGRLHAFLDRRCYDVMFVECGNDSYRRIKAIRPDVVIVCVSTRRSSDFHLLNMLVFNPGTSCLFMATFDIDDENHDEDWAELDLADGNAYAPVRRSEQMN